MKIWIDSKPLEARADQNILQVARDNNIYIPSLCYHPRIGTLGKCRSCMVEIEGQSGLHTACTTPVSENMSVHTGTPAVREFQKTVCEMMLTSGRHDCLSCEACGDCELQDMAYRLGIEHLTIQPESSFVKSDCSSPGIDLDFDKCIKCGRCVAACRDLVVNETLNFGFRGSDTRIICDDDKPMGESSCVQCGECVQVCPVGAFIFKPSKGRARQWEMESTKVTCPYCAIGCQIDVQTRDKRIVNSLAHENRFNEQPNKGQLCVKGRFGLDYVHSPERLRIPLIRKNDKLVECSWDEALDFTAERLKSIRSAHGADAIGFLAPAKASNEDNYALMRFARAVIGTNNIDHCARL